MNFTRYSGAYSLSLWFSSYKQLTVNEFESRFKATLRVKQHQKVHSRWRVWHYTMLWNRMRYAFLERYAMGMLTSAVITVELFERSDNIWSNYVGADVWCKHSLINTTGLVHIFNDVPDVNQF